METRTALRLPRELTEAIESETTRKRSPMKAQVAALRELFELFTHERSSLPKIDYLAEPRLRSAYLKYHLPLNFIRSLCVLRTLSRLAKRLDAVDLVVDIGAGPGASSLATRAALAPNDARRFLLTDRSRSALKLAKQLHGSLATDPETRDVKTIVSRLPSMPRIERPALIWLSMVLNELSLGDRRGVDPIYLARQLSRSVPAGSVLLIVEPALREPSRDLMDFRETLLEQPGWRLLGPCTHEAPCPLIDIRSRPWCHFHVAWRPPRFVSQIADPLGLDADQCSLSYLAFERISKGDAPPENKLAARVIGDTMEVRGKKRGIYVCREGKREIEAAPSSDLSGRGDVITVEAEPRVLQRWPGRAPPTKPRSKR